MSQHDYNGQFTSTKNEKTNCAQKNDLTKNNDLIYNDIKMKENDNGYYSILQCSYILIYHTPHQKVEHDCI